MKRHIWPVLLIAITAIALYSNTLNNSFVYDDSITVVDNTFIKSLSNLSGLFKPDIYFAASGELTYRPIVTFTYFLDYAIFGLNAGGFHLVNALLHAANGMLLYAFLLLFTGKRWLSFASTLIFITHPVLTEALNAISFREDLLAFFFYMAALNLFLTLRSPSGFTASWIFYQLSCLCYLLALFSKEMALTFPLVVFIYDWTSAKKGLRSLLSNLYLIGFVVITLIYLILRFTYLYNPLEVSVSGWEFTERLYTIPYLLFNYLKLILFPVSLSVEHDLHPVASLSSPFFLLPLAAIIVLLIMVFRVWKKENDIALGASFFFLTLLPVYNIIPLSNPFAERYLYLPMAGIAIMAGGFMNLISQRYTTGYTTYLIPLAVILSINSLAVVNRNSIWRDDKQLWTDALKKSPDSPRVHNGMGMIYYKEGSLEKAIDEYNLAIKIDPAYQEAHANLGVAYYDLGEFDNALSHIKEAVRLNPYDHKSYFNLGFVYRRIGQTDNAILHYTISLRLNPFSSKANNNLGLLYSELGRTEEAIKHFKNAIMLDPLYIRPRKNLADLYFRIGEYDKAIDEYSGKRLP